MSHLDLKKGLEKIYLCLKRENASLSLNVFEVHVLHLDTRTHIHIQAEVVCALLEGHYSASSRYQ